MIIQSAYSLEINKDFDTSVLAKDNWLVVLHASRIPPHIGILIDGNYNSLTIKGHELNVSIQALLKTVQQKKIETVFIKLKEHPVFSSDYQKEVCQHFIKQYQQVKSTESTCLSPIKLYLQEFYAISVIEDELMYQLMDRLKQNDYITHVYGLNRSVPEEEFCFPIYSKEELEQTIRKERSPFYND